MSDDLSVVLWAERVREAQGGGSSTSSWTPPTATGDMARSRRKRAARPATLGIREMKRRHLPVVPPDPAESLPTRPTTRAECLTTERPCPFASCRHHLYLDVHPKSGAIKVNFPDLELWELPESCALDVAERGGLPGSGQGEGVLLEDVATVMNITRERVRQLEVSGIAHMLRADRLGKRALTQHAEDEGLGLTKTRRHLPILDLPDPDEDDEDEGADDLG